MAHRIRIAILFILAFFSISEEAHATLVKLEEVPVWWFIQDYVGSDPGGVVMFHANNLANNACYAANAGTAELTFASNVTDQEVDRFWSSVISARAMNLNMFVYYDDKTCQIASFGIPSQGL